MSYFLFYETNADGEPKDPHEGPRRIEYADIKKVLALHYRGPYRQLCHYIDLACAAPKHEIDVTHFRDDLLLYSARLRYVPDAAIEKARMSVFAPASTVRRES